LPHASVEAFSIGSSTSTNTRRRVWQQSE
jgi:hypothetical protein